MSERDRVKVVDGYTALKAAQRAGGKEEKPRALSKSAEKAEKPSTPGTHISRTVMPTSYEIICHECDYTFQLTGRAQNTFCPKCRTVLDLVDYTIETKWSEPLKTAGIIRLTPEGTLKSGSLLATDIILEGRIEGGTAQAHRTLEIHPGAAFNEECVSAKDLVVKAGAEATFKKTVTFRNVDVEGTLKARLRATDTVTVRTGALLQGEVRSPHLVVEEGGGLKARIKAEPPAGEDEPESSEKTA